MNFKEAIDIIEKHERCFMVHFEVVEGGLLHSDYFPDKHAGERLIPTEIEAWELASRFAKATDDNYVNIYVIDDKFKPVNGYESRIFKAYPHNYA
jgi:hypothetical protein